MTQHHFSLFAGNAGFRKIMLLSAAVFAAGALLARPAPAMAAQGTVIYSFKGNADGAVPTGPLIADTSGSLYGVTYLGGQGEGGTVFQLSPPTTPGGAWTHTVLHTFQGGNDGDHPLGPLIFDDQGVLVGTTFEGGAGNAGVVFRMAPQGSNWTTTTIYSFRGGVDGAAPVGGLIRDTAGAFYGVTQSGGIAKAGTIYKLSPPPAGETSGSWRKLVLYAFGGGVDGAQPIGSLAFDKSGRLYGATLGGGASGGGTIFQLTPSAPLQTPWAKKTVYAFTGSPDGSSPNGSLVFSTSGAIYGTTSLGGPGFPTSRNIGVAFQLSPPAQGQTAWTYAALFDFTSRLYGPHLNDGLIFDTSGSLYGTSGEGAQFENAVVYRLTQANGQMGWTESVIWGVSGGVGAENPYLQGGLLFGQSGVLYGVLPSDIYALDYGRIFQVTTP